MGKVQEQVQVQLGAAKPTAKVEEKVVEASILLFDPASPSTKAYAPIRPQNRKLSTGTFIFFNCDGESKTLSHRIAFTAL
eukprot:scaffold2775_cov171-Ochromonas_danica.AAC.4